MKIRTQPYVDDNGDRYYNVLQATQIVGGVCKKTLGDWARNGVTSFGLKLHCKHQPISHDPRGYRHEAITHRKTRLLIPEAEILVLREILQAAGKSHPDPKGGRWTAVEIDTLQAFTRRRARSIRLQHG